MKTVSMRVLVTLGTLAWLASIAQAQSGYSGQMKQKKYPRIGVRQVDHLLDSGVGEEMPISNSDPFMDDGYSGGGSCPNCMPGGCQPEYCGDCGGCYGGYCGECDGGCYDGCYGDCYGEYCGECPDYGCNQGACGCGGNGACAGMCYAEAQAVFIRAHVPARSSFDKLSETYEASPRVILGYEAPSGMGMRARYWHYDEETEIIGTTIQNDAVGFELEVLDLEGTARFHTKRTDLVLAGGFRWADFSIDEGNDEISNSMLGLTFAGDVRTMICCKGRTEWAGVFGARWSILGGDWEGDRNAFIDRDEIRDDNVTVQEIYGGVEFLCHHCKHDCYARLVFEMQNWRSDALGESSETDSISFIGPAAQVGIAY